jgi:hypothetical protein
MNRQVAANNSRPQTKSCHRNARVGGPYAAGTIREGYTQAPPSFTRTNAALNSGFRSCQFSQASGF